MDDPIRLLEDYTGFSKLTPDLCIKHCIGRGFRYAGVQAGSQCFCGNTAPPQSKIVDQRQCNTRCNGDGKQFCGGGWRMNVFDTHITKASVVPPTSTSTTISTTTSAASTKSLSTTYRGRLINYQKTNII